MFLPTKKASSTPAGNNEEDGADEQKNDGEEDSYYDADVSLLCGLSVMSDQRHL